MTNDIVLMVFETSLYLFAMHDREKMASLGSKVTWVSRETE